VETVGLIAGQGHFPGELARAARNRGVRVVAVGLRQLADPRLEADVDAFHWLHLGEFGALFEIFAKAGTRDVVMVGKVPKTFLWTQREAIRPDAHARELLGRLPDRADDSLQGAVAALLEEHGFHVVEQLSLAPQLAASEGVLGAVAPTERQRLDIAFAWPVAKTLGALDVGQTVVVQGRAILALEAVEGTDEAIRRGCRLGLPGASVIKVAKPQQDLRFDLPAVGAETLDTLIAARGGLLAVEAGRTVLMEQERVIRAADAHGIALLGVPAEGPG